MSKAIFGDLAVRRGDPTAACTSREGEVSPASTASAYERTVFLLAHRSPGHTPRASHAATAEPDTTSRCDAESWRRDGAGLPPPPSETSHAWRGAPPSRRETQASICDQYPPGDCQFSFHPQVAPARMTENNAKCAVWVNIGNAGAGDMRSHMGNPDLREGAKMRTDERDEQFFFPAIFLPGALLLSAVGAPLAGRAWTESPCYGRRSGRH